MKNPKPIVKILTILGFVTLITGFVAYRAGSFENKPAEIDAGERDASDTPDVKQANANDSSATSPFYLDETMSSSKSGYVFDEELVSKEDSVKKTEKKKKNTANNNTTTQTPKTQTLIMGSSKSDKMFTPQDDTIRKKK
jgi:hypothetical protein